jgi:hypothetical protein
MTTTISSISRQGAYEPFELQVSRGQIMGHRVVNVFGYNADIDTALETVWPQGGVLTRPAAALAMKVSSSSADDDAAGTGARTVVIQGLDADYNEVSETVTLDGQTAVTMTVEMIRVNYLFVASAGSGATAAGTIYVGTGTVTSGVPATIYNMIAVGYNASLTGSYTVPAGHTGYVVSGLFTAGQLSGTQAVTGELSLINSDLIKRVAAISTLNNGVASYPFDYPVVVPQKTTVEALAIGSGSNNLVSAKVQMVLIKNDGGA